MRANQVLVAKGWYWVLTDVNNREAVLRLPRAVQLLREMLCRARGIYEFEGRGLACRRRPCVVLYQCRGRGCGSTPQSGTALATKPFRF
jgi:hypothetical protein